MTPKTLLAPARLAGLPLLRSQSDERLVDLVRAGNDAAFEAIVARYRRPLLRHASRILSEERAEDVVQQAFVRALKAMRADDRTLDLKPWLYTITHNAALNALRERAVPSATLEEEIDGVERPEQAFERRQSLREMVAAVAALPERQRDAIVLRELEGRSYEEIAAELGVSDGAVRQLLNRARNTLRAGVTAVTPFGLLLRIGAEEPVVARIAELTAGAGAGTAAATVAATALVTGAVMGGVAAVPEERNAAEARPGPTAGEALGPSQRAGDAAEPGTESGEGSEEAGAGTDDKRRGRGGDDDRSDDDRSGRRDGDEGGEDNSGPGSAGDGLREDSSGPGSGDRSDSGSDNSGPGSGDSSGSGDSGSSGSGSGSGSGSSGSGSSGSGSGSGSSGSGSSGSGSSGSGSGEDAEDRSGSNSGSG